MKVNLSLAEHSSVRQRSTVSCANRASAALPYLSLLAPGAECDLFYCLE